MKFNKIHHVAIICSNYEISKKFYTEKLGLAIINEEYRKERKSYKLDLQIGDSQIELFSFENPPKRPTTPEACGLRHLCLEVDDIIATIKELEALDIEVEPVRIDGATNKKYTFFKDPDDLPLELYEK